MAVIGYKAILDALQTILSTYNAAPADHDLSKNILSRKKVKKEDGSLGLHHTESI